MFNLARGITNLFKPRVPFEAIIQSLNLPERARVLDIGAGGFVGASTTQYLIKNFSGHIVAIEHFEERCEALKDKYGDRLEIRCADFLKFDFGYEKFDLISIDVDCYLIPDIYNEWLQNKVYPILKPGGYAVVVNFNKIKDPPDESGGISASVQEDCIPFLMQRFGSRHVTLENVREAYKTDSLFEGIDVRGKWTDRENLLNWVVLRSRKK